MMLNKIKNGLWWLAIGGVVLGSAYYFLFALPRQMNAIATDRTVFKAAPGITCVQVAAKEAIALSCVKD